MGRCHFVLGIQHRGAGGQPQVIAGLDGVQLGLLPNQSGLGTGIQLLIVGQGVIQAFEAGLEVLDCGLVGELSGVPGMLRLLEQVLLAGGAVVGAGVLPILFRILQRLLGTAQVQLAALGNASRPAS